MVTRGLRSLSLFVILMLVMAVLYTEITYEDREPTYEKFYINLETPIVLNILAARRVSSHNRVLNNKRLKNFFTKSASIISQTRILCNERNNKIIFLEPAILFLERLETPPPLFCLYSTYRYSINQK